MVERFLGKEEVTGSIPVVGSINFQQFAFTLGNSDDSLNYVRGDS